MREIFKLLLAFAPWLAFWFIAGHSIPRLQIAVAVAAAMTVIMAIAKLHRGAIMWAGFAFFSFAMISVVWLKNPWVIHHLGILASGTLFVSAQLSMLIGRPFTESYARQSTPKQFWEHAAFARGCFITTAAWSCIFLINTLLNVVKLCCPDIPEWRLTVTEYFTIAAGIAFTNIFSRIARKRRQAVTTPPTA